MDRKRQLIEQLIAKAVSYTVEEGLNTTEEIRAFAESWIGYTYKTDSSVTMESKKKMAAALSEAIIFERFGNTNEPKTSMKIYIARDRAVFEDEKQEGFVRRHPEKENQYGRLRLFYERPVLNNKTGIWEQARGAAEIENYMFPHIRCEECAEFQGPGMSNEYPHYPGMFLTLDK